MHVERLNALHQTSSLPSAERVNAPVSGLDCLVGKIRLCSFLTIWWTHKTLLSSAQDRSKDTFRSCLSTSSSSYHVDPIVRKRHGSQIRKRNVPEKKRKATDIRSFITKNKGLSEIAFFLYYP
ncbi:hypothetical protein PoB_004122000 [Plakobranchus ocellatus]|uniref:Uncharacterized protein n=1 Tax=Plakobranchus ocellatus TaxID=259542 RepID=A0AAV4B6N3_9GAST|nr:hypothetical protein PoB_004122000 [Plakobranchus ocellatus]